MEGWRKLAEEGEATAIAYARAEKGLLAQIAEHEQRAARRRHPRRTASSPTSNSCVGFKGERRTFGRHRLACRWKFGPQDQPT
ncbi:hypothetical protein F6X54_28720 [Micromonospora aurantiaca]|uniref:Transposase n=1 Tax=Micromonospora aurantiaca (nom. illeg.) TaxID=47850 RepID=A0ABQ6U8K0_9ACTN|nr:hypothetical protein [Micromonospora aurantiaca]KAB1103931.1 hypothetical protein F6X54_28720 [Micromonospora aurantiaca]